MKIKIKDKAKITKAIGRCQWACEGNKLNYGDFVKGIKAIERLLRALLPKKDWNGIGVDMDLKGVPGEEPVTYSTQCFIVRRSDQWFLTSIERRVISSPGNPYQIKFLKQQEDLITQKIRRPTL